MNFNAEELMLMMQNNHSRIDSSHSYRKPLCSYKDAENHNAYNQRNLIE